MTPIRLSFQEMTRTPASLTLRFRTQDGSPALSPAALTPGGRPGLSPLGRRTMLGKVRIGARCWSIGVAQPLGMNYCLPERATCLVAQRTSRMRRAQMRTGLTSVDEHAMASDMPCMVLSRSLPSQPWDLQHVSDEEVKAVFLSFANFGAGNSALSPKVSAFNHDWCSLCTQIGGKSTSVASQTRQAQLSLYVWLAA